MAINIKAEEFAVKCVGEITGEQWFGTFKVRPVLPHGLQLEQDRLRREFLGVHPDAASPRALNQAQIFSNLQVSIIEAPPWWEKSGNGLALVDDEVVKAVSEGVNKIQNDFYASLKKKQDAAKADLEKVKAAQAAE